MTIPPQWTGHYVVVTCSVPILHALHCVTGRLLDVNVETLLLDVSGNVLAIRSDVVVSVFLPLDQTMVGLELRYHSQTNGGTRP